MFLLGNHLPVSLHLLVALYLSLGAQRSLLLPLVLGFVDKE